MAVSQADLEAAAEAVGAALRTRGWMLAVAESCTGGWLAQSLTAIAGSSAWFERGFVTYSNAAKVELLGVRPATLAVRGAVSGEVAAEMSEGALRHSRAQVALAITGIAGPGGGSPDKPVGLVWFAWSLGVHHTDTEVLVFSGDRRQVRMQAVAYALEGLRARLAAMP